MLFKIVLATIDVVRPEIDPKLIFVLEHSIWVSLWILDHLWNLPWKFSATGEVCYWPEAEWSNKSKTATYEPLEEHSRISAASPCVKVGWSCGADPRCSAERSASLCGPEHRWASSLHDEYEEWSTKSGADIDDMWRGRFSKCNDISIFHSSTYHVISFFKKSDQCQAFFEAMCIL